LSPRANQKSCAGRVGLLRAPARGVVVAELVGEVRLSEEELELVARRAAELVREELAVAASLPASPFLDVAEAAVYIRAKPQRIYDLLSQGRLTRRKDGSRVLVERVELDAYLAGERVGCVALASPTRSRSVNGSGVAR
jgi:excisionase family DNA binding protein